MNQTDTVERTAIVAYVLLQEAHRVLADPCKPDDVTLGIIVGTAMFCDETVGPFRARKLMQGAPDIVLRADAHVTDEAAVLSAPVLRAFGKHLQEIGTRRKSAIDMSEVTAA
jgi:hypothetical protein